MRFVHIRRRSVRARCFPFRRGPFARDLTSAVVIELIGQKWIQRCISTDLTPVYSRQLAAGSQDLAEMVILYLVSNNISRNFEPRCEIFNFEPVD